MLVKFNHDLSDQIMSSMTEKESRHYSSIKSSFFRERIYVVYGILMFDSARLYLICEDEKRTAFGLYSQKFFDLEASDIPNFWYYFPGIAHKFLVYGDLSFNKFDYIGINRIINEESFFEAYLNDGKEELNYLKKMIDFIDSDARSSNLIFLQYLKNITVVENRILLCENCRRTFENSGLNKKTIICSNCGEIGIVKT